MTHFQKTHLHTGLFADLSKETIGFQVPIVVPDSDGTASEEEFNHAVEEFYTSGAIEDSEEMDWEALREAEIDEAYNNLIHYESFDDASVPF
jgi:hypothetical protein